MHKLDALPDGWEQYTHLDGKPYFRHPTWSVVTEANIRERRTREAIEALHARVHEAFLEKKVQLEITDNMDKELYLSVNPEGYYYVDHTTQDVFWLQDISFDYFAPNDEAKHMSFGVYTAV